MAMKHALWLCLLLAGCEGVALSQTCGAIQEGAYRVTGPAYFGTCGELDRMVNFGSSLDPCGTTVRQNGCKYTIVRTCWGLGYAETQGTGTNGSYYVFERLASEVTRSGSELRGGVNLSRWTSMGTQDRCHSIYASVWRLQ